MNKKELTKTKAEVEETLYNIVINSIFALECQTDIINDVEESLKQMRKDRTALKRKIAKVESQYEKATGKKIPAKIKQIFTSL